MQLIEKIAPFYILFVILELFYSLYTNKRVYSFQDTVADISTGTISRLVDVLVLVFAMYLYEFFRFHFGSLFNLQIDFSSPILISELFPYFIFQWKQAIHWLCMFLLADLVFYTYHRSSHEINFLWASHVVHHSSKEYNFSVALRQTMFRNLVYIFFALPLTFLNIPWEVLLISDALNRTYQFWTHTRLVPKLPKWFEFIFVTPSHHRVHHGINPKYIDKNYSGFLIIWDRIFGTFQEEEEEPVYGITKPVNTYNPVLVNFHVYQEIFKKTFSFIPFAEKLGYIFKNPAWTPGNKIVESVQREIQVENFSARYKFLVILYFIILVLSSLVFIKLSVNILLLQKFGIILLFLFLFWYLGKLLDFNNFTKKTK